MTKPFHSSQNHAMTTQTYPCPHCKKPTLWANNPFKPFCSERCKLIDLGAWATESYKVPADDVPFSDELTKQADQQ